MSGDPNTLEVFPKPLTAAESHREPPPIVRSRRARLTLPRPTMVPTGRRVVGLITATRGVTCRDSYGSEIVQAWQHGVGAPI